MAYKPAYYRIYRQAQIYPFFYKFSRTQIITAFYRSYIRNLYIFESQNYDAVIKFSIFFTIRS